MIQVIVCNSVIIVAIVKNKLVAGIATTSLLPVNRVFFDDFYMLYWPPAVPLAGAYGTPRFLRNRLKTILCFSVAFLRSEKLLTHCRQLCNIHTRTTVCLSCISIETRPEKNLGIDTAGWHYR